jgi:hypothetical protein
MNSWLLLRRLRGPAFLILLGFTALLNQWGVLSFARSWPLYLILAGVFGLAERAAMAAAPPAPPAYPTAYAPPGYSAGGYTPVSAYPPTSGSVSTAEPAKPFDAGWAGDDPGRRP